MIISSIKILQSNFEISFSKKVTTILGHTGSKKTLIYRLMLYVLGAPISLDINAIKNNFSNTTYIELQLKESDHIISLKREISQSFHGYIGDNEFNSLKEYNSNINTLFKTKTTRVENGNKSCEFGFRELLNFVFIPEEQLSSSKSIFVREGFAEKEKILNFFRYVVSGESINETETKEKTSIKKDKTSVNGFKTALNRRIQKPTAKDIKEKERITGKLVETHDKIEKLNSDLLNKSQEKKQLIITLERINSLYKTYLSNIEEVKAGLTLKAVVDNNPVISDSDSLFLNGLESELLDLEKTIKYLNAKINKINESIETITKAILDLESKEKDLNLELNSYSFVSHYETIQSAYTEIFGVLEKEENELKEKIELQQKAINKTYEEKLSRLCKSISARLANWGIGNIEVSFDSLNADFRFNNEHLTIIPKGYKTIYSLATAYELLLLSKENGISNLSTIIIDSLWVASDIEHISKNELIKKIVDDLALGSLNVIIFENEMPLEESNELAIVKIQ